MGKRRGGILAGIALALTALFYGRALRFDLQCDDLLVIRPWSRAELAGVWHGTWEPTHVFATFFRPIASWFYAGSFELFGLNAPAHMLLSLALLAAVTWLLALFIAREHGSLAVGMIAALVYLAHPNVPWSTGTWVTNDFHKLTAISALCGLLLWQRVRHRPWADWLLLVPFVAVSFLVKEDGLMLIPAFISLQWLRARLVGDVKSPGISVLAGAAVFGVALVAWRYLALRELGGFGVPPMSAVFQNLARGPLYAFTFHGSLSVLTVTEKLLAIVIAVVVGLGIALLPKPQRFLPMAGMALMFWYDLPLALISNVMRYYMLTIASVMVLVPVFFAWLSAPKYRWAAAVALAMIFLLNIASRRQETELMRFAPCNWAEQRCAPWVLEEVTTLPREARPYIADTAAACATNVSHRPLIGRAGTLTWGLGSTTIDTMNGEASNAVTGDVVTLIRSHSATAGLLFRHPEASASRPVHVVINADGRYETRDLTGPEWLRIDVPLTNGMRSWLRGAHRVDATFSAPGAEWKSVGR